METKVTDQLARTIARATDANRFDRSGYDPKACAQRNLSGRSHYCDDDTLRYFHSRVLSAHPECGGLILIIVESVAADPDNRKRGFRFVAFDLFGTVINDRPSASPETLQRTSDKASQEATDWLQGFDVLAHYRDTLRERAERLHRNARQMLECAADL